LQTCTRARCNPSFRWCKRHARIAPDKCRQAHGCNWRIESSSFPPMERQQDCETLWRV
jgi:hypothetical protein